MADQGFQYSGEIVGHAFVNQFYEILHGKPEDVYKFYDETSTMTRPNREGELVTVTKMQGIRDLILSLDSTNFKAEILTADAQASHGDGVMVLVTGCLTGKDNVKRHFTESFFLAPQSKGYFVLNDVFRIVEEASLPVGSSAENHIHKSPTASSVSVVAPVQGTGHVASSSVENDTAAANDKAEVLKASDDEQPPAVAQSAVPQSSVAEEPVSQSSVAQKTLPQSSVGSSQNVLLVVEASSNGHADSVPKKTYASLLMNGKVGLSTAPLQGPANAQKPRKPNPASKSVGSPSVPQTGTVSNSPAPAAVAVAVAVSGSSAPNGIASRNGHVEDKGHSVYIGDLPYNATIELVEQEFKKFGRIKRNGIQVRSNKNYCFGFVEYEEASAKESALEANRVQIGDKWVRIEDKVTHTRVVNGVTYNSGRGGSRNDNYRRSHYSNGRGFMKNDHSKGNGEVSSRGSRNGDGYVYQNGGGRGGARQGGSSK